MFAHFESCQMSRQIQRITGIAAIAFGVCSIVCFCVWLEGTDWLMGHTYGSASSIIAAFWTASVSVTGTGICLVLALFTKSAHDGDARKNDVRWLVRQRYALALMLIPVGLVAVVSYFQLQRANQVLQVKRIRTGEASVDELIVVLQTPRPNLDFTGAHNAAIEELGRRGPQSKDAVPVLARLLEDLASTRMVAKSLAAIGPDAQEAIPALADVIRREQGKGSGIGSDGPSLNSSFAGRALTAIGESSIPELVRLLSHEDRFVRICAARSLGDMGPKAKDAVPALKEALEDEDETVRRYVSRALEKIEPRPAKVDRSHSVPKQNDKIQEPLSASWTNQPPYAGDPRERPRGTVVLRFDDGYRWLITGSVRKWEHRVEGNRKIHAAITGTVRYEHVLGTHEFRVIDPMTKTDLEGVNNASHE